MPLFERPSQRLLCLAQAPGEQASTGDIRQTRLIEDAWKQSGKVYGCRKLHDDLQDQGETSCANRIARLARLAGIKAQIGYRRRPGTHGGKPSAVVDNTLARQFDVDVPDTAWVTYITYIKTTEGFAYLAMVIDLFSRRVIGWSGNNWGNSTSSVSTGKRRDTGPFGVSDASRPLSTTSFNIRRAVRSERPVIRAASPRSNSPRIAAVGRTPSPTQVRSCWLDPRSRPSWKRYSAPHSRPAGGRSAKCIDQVGIRRQPGRWRGTKSPRAPADQFL
ncbi:MAG: IS3 family transposase [Alphaproteobacteria bacterium]|nr:IS3 family transposase [Alphaproteobacteria bacterium]